MKLLSISNAKSIWLFSTNDLNPRGMRIDGLLDGLRERYKFQIMPTPVQLHEFVTKREAVQLSMGAFDWSGGAAAIALTYYSDGLMVETRAGTQAGDEYLSDLLGWLKATYGMTDASLLPIRKIYASEMYVSMAKNLTMIHPKLKGFAENFGSKVFWPNPSLAFDVTGISFGADPISKAQHPPFKLERDIQAPFEHNRYFSSAPLPTDEHLTLLEQLESLLKP